MAKVFKPLIPELEGFALNNGHINNLKREFQHKATFLLFFQLFLMTLQTSL